MGAGQLLEQSLDDRQAEPAARRVALPQTTMRGEPCEVQREATQGAFKRGLRYATHFPATATDLLPAARWQV